MIGSDSTDYLYSIIHFFVLNCNFLVSVFLFFYCIIFFNKILLLLLICVSHICIHIPVYMYSSLLIYSYI